MELNHLTPAALSELIRIVEEKQTLLAKIEKIDASMETLIKNNTVVATAVAPAKFPRKITAKPAAKAVKAAAPAPAETSASAAPVAVSAPKAPAPVRAKRGALKEGILAALAAAGAEGLSVSELSARLGVEPANIHVWFSTTGKKLSEITKVAAGRYALGAVPSAVEAAVETAPEETPVVIEIIEAAAEPAIIEIIEPEPVAVEVVEIVESEPEAPAASFPPEPEPAAVEPTVEEIVIVESVIELEPEAAAEESAEADEAPTPGKHDDFLLSSN